MCLEAVKRENFFVKQPQILWRLQNEESRFQRKRLILHQNLKSNYILPSQQDFFFSLDELTTKTKFMIKENRIGVYKDRLEKATVEVQRRIRSTQVDSLVLCSRGSDIYKTYILPDDLSRSYFSRRL